MKVSTEDKHYQRDIHSKALLQTDKGLADEYLMKKRLMEEQKSQKNELSQVKSDIEEIKNLLKGIIQSNGILVT